MNGPAKVRPFVVFTGGGTAGHIYPGLAVIEAMRSLGFGGRILWIGSRKESDREAVERAGVEFLAIPSGKLRRKLSLENLVDLFRVLRGYRAARRILRGLEPDLVFSKGGYVSVPPCRAAAGLGIPVCTHESDLTPGLATRLNSRKAERILTSYARSAGHFPESLRSRIVCVGNPVREAFRRADPAKGRAFAGAPGNLPLVMFVGGSQGARQINEIVDAILPSLAGKAFVVHQTGVADAEGTESGARIPIPGRYAPFAYIRDEMPDLLAAADIVVGRSGAGTLWECGALGKPMVLVPLCGSGTRGDQVDNARIFESAGAARVLVGDEARPENVLAAILDFIDNPGKRSAAGLAAAGLAGADAARASASLILDRIGGIP
jgi:UDP-N-acetylglucosamine--N-acetylmuramyl-(pentapeptide) pyrophosphoryl-undecaprenol N-acetylglucosamine transferase